MRGREQPPHPSVWIWEQNIIIISLPQSHPGVCVQAHDLCMADFLRSSLVNAEARCMHRCKQLWVCFNNSQMSLLCCCCLPLRSDQHAKWLKCTMP